MKVWREQDWGRAWGWEGRQRQSWPHTGTLSHSQSLSPGHTNSHVHACVFGEGPKALQTRSMCFLTSSSLCYPPTHIHLHSFLFSFSSTKGMSTHTVHKACQHIKVFVYVFNTQGMFVKLKNRLMTLQTYLSYILLYFCVLWPLSADNCQNVTPFKLQGSFSFN